MLSAPEDPVVLIHQRQCRVTSWGHWPALATCASSSFDPLLSKTLQWSPVQALRRHFRPLPKETAVAGRELNLSPV